MKNFSGFDDVDVDEKRKTKDERRKTKDVDRKRTVERRKLIFKTTCVREGATVAASTLQYGRPFVRRAVRQRSSMETFKPSAGKLH